eukprot:313052-Rhodomonas_salina.4
MPSSRSAQVRSLTQHIDRVGGVWGCYLHVLAARLCDLVVVVRLVHAGLRQVRDLLRALEQRVTHADRQIVLHVHETALADALGARNLGANHRLLVPSARSGAPAEGGKHAP